MIHRVRVSLVGLVRRKVLGGQGRVAVAPDEVSVFVRQRRPRERGCEGEEPEGGFEQQHL